MPTFETPDPISVHLSIAAGDVEFRADDRTETVVEVRPSNSSEASRRAAEETKVDYSGGKLQIRGPKPRRRLFGKQKNVETTSDESIHVAINLPTGSRVQGDAAVGCVDAQGRLGAFRFESGCGDIRIEETTGLRLEAGLGNVTVKRVQGDVDITVAQGKLRIADIDGSATIENLSGVTKVGHVARGLTVQATNGDVSVGRADGDVKVKNANGDVQVSEVTRGSITLETAHGSIEVGVHEDSAAHIDAQALVGGVRNSLNSADGPGTSDETVNLHLRTLVGQIDIHRS
ncbi:DUF4097 domain-containing protein [Streptomyces sp. QL37]|uniref:DUF4097 family beta strand repeat-containing protein n=1 Tax=Streptomyces sp. QL37 TaxID=2093747 RepID=UPI000CF1D00F|nr:DUF4097 family beta strand repeat-containing protein [Streptomyces sp. QL37]PPQ60240.1 hypothetical protein C5F59_28855 [Streptomyces sp. QL37]